jgi:predicted RNase H-like HicB family nuclease
VSSYVVLIEATPDGRYGAWAPDLPGCVALGDSFEACLSEMRAAVAFHLDGMCEEGLDIPRPTTQATTVDAA